MEPNLDIPPEPDKLGPTIPDKLENGRRKARRRMAWFSFWFLSASCAAILYKLLWNGDAQSIATALVTASPVLTGIFVVYSSIILGYLGVSVVEKVFKKG